VSERCGFGREMTSYVALLRAVNVGGTGKLPMAALAELCNKAGFAGVRTYLNSGNAVFKSDKSEGMVKSALEARLKQYAGGPVGVLVRTAREMAAVQEQNPFPGKPPAKTVAIFLDRRPTKDALENLVGKGNEEVRLGEREIYVYYADGIGRSKLKIPAATNGTARNMNTIAKLAELASRL
jgi:uncharacterized protein (DUF1697 family)